MTTQRKNYDALHQGFFFVSEGGKISNLKVIEDLYKILLSFESEVFGE